MEAMISIAQSGGALSSLADGPASSLDELALERARDRQRPREEDEHWGEPTLESTPPQIAWLPLLSQSLDLPRRSESFLAEAAVKADKVDRRDGLARDSKPVKKDMLPLLDVGQSKQQPSAIALRGGQSNEPNERAALAMQDARQVNRVRVAAGQGALRNGAQSEESSLAMQAARQAKQASPVAKQEPQLPSEQEVEVISGMPAAAKPGDLVQTRSKSALSQMGKNVSFQAGSLDSAQSMADVIPLTQVPAASQPSSLQAERSRAAGPESATVPRRMAGEAKASMVSGAVSATQNGLTYQFRLWGNEHSVTVQGTLSGSLLLQPSDVLVAQRLGEQWQSGNPQQWQLARDGGEGRGQQQPQRDEEDESGC
ncbi:type III secretion system needle length determinant, SpaN/EivJ family [Chromobacterium amazonense]|uniref:Type III secretion system needle length determinant, SpaN/EivJ family n=1 Tax=Chromobacterium amazonense TaxID=1382803 RepID=A0ABU8V1M0_9NEIS|nr:type III secretion system needle length determinant, SpaN/EivJ family [Chromobacterium amazonense]MDQ4541474.1 type III secretion system needle length determinant, SpaN/EivJ family [Chromobacterium amazonense]